jgi:hypothetical protein
MSKKKPPPPSPAVEGLVSYDTLARVRDALDAAGLPFDLSLPPPGRSEPGWHVVTRADGLIVRLDARPGATATQQASADALVLGLDLTAAALATAELATLRGQAKQLFDATDAEGKRDRGIAWLLVNQLNALRQWDMSFKAAVAAATTLVDLKAKVALLPDLAQITLSAARQAFRDLQDAGTADAPP